ncbi:MAG: transporter substrate-binding domain-containing protein [Hyphomicrobiales bacterium]|nr:transporter substrate-binding domain-containing protein [Hyphomicrobiales bacterium]
MAALVVALSPFSPDSAGAQEAVTVPNFWDPKRHVDTPRTDAIPSIRFLTTDNFPPFNFIDSHGRLAGFHIDLARALCAEFKINCTIQARPFADLIDALAEGHGDAIIAGISPDRTERGKVEFSDVYMRLPARFVARSAEAGMEISPDTLAGVPVAVVAHTAHEAYLTTFFAEADIRSVRTIDDMRTALKSGEVTLFFADGLSSSFWIAGDSSENCCAFAGGPYLEPRYFGNGFSIAVNRGNGLLRGILDYGLRRLYEKGVFAELYLRYFPVGFY